MKKEWTSFTFADHTILRRRSAAAYVAGSLTLKTVAHAILSPLYGAYLCSYILGDSQSVQLRNATTATIEDGGLEHMKQEWTSLTIADWG